MQDLTDQPSNQGAVTATPPYPIDMAEFWSGHLQGRVNHIPHTTGSVSPVIQPVNQWFQIRLCKRFQLGYLRHVYPLNRGLQGRANTHISLFISHKLFEDLTHHITTHRTPTTHHCNRPKHSDQTNMSYGPVEWVQLNEPVGSTST
jgi:hypothetical protein